MIRYIIVLLSIASFNSFSQDSLIYDLQEVKVSANINQTELIKTARNVSLITALEIQNSPTKTIDGILQYALNIDVRSRSPLGVQSDISIRGGHFDQTLVMIDGVKMNDPQTGHHSMNLPIPIEQIERIEVLQGGASRVYGPSAFSGVINIITKKSSKNEIGVGIIGGENGLYQINANAGFKEKSFDGLIAVSKMHSDGYAYNTSFERTSFFANASHESKRGLLTLQGGLMSNEFGASNFYHPRFNNQYEETQSSFLSLTKKHNFSNSFSGTLIASVREHDDLYDFNLYRENVNSLNNVNFHKSKIYDFEWKMRYLSEFGASSFGLEWRQEGVISNRLGEEVMKAREVKDYPNIFYNKEKKRQNFSSYFEQQKNWDKLSISGGALLNFNSQFGTELYPGLDISLSLGKEAKLYGTANRSLRFPTFTEMYLNTSTVKADPNLLPEKALNYELGWKYFKNWMNLTTSIFYRQTSDAIDKVKRTELEVPTMENIDNINMAGFELLAQFNISKKIARPTNWLQRIQLNYAYLKADRKEDNFQSFYTLNYLRHKANVGTYFRISDHFRASLIYTYKFREGEYQWDADSPIHTYKPIHLLDTRFNYSNKWFNGFIDINNILNYEYFEFGFVEQPRRWISAGIKLSFN